MTKERRHSCPETYFTSQGCVTQSTLRLKQEVKTTVFLVTKPKLAFIRARPIYGLPVPFVLQAAFDAGGPMSLSSPMGPISSDDTQLEDKDCFVFDSLQSPQAAV